MTTSQSNERLRRALLERMPIIGLCPDLKNDEASVDAICRELGVSRQEVARELMNLRLQKGQGILQRMGFAAMPPAFLASLSATRRSLVQRQRSSAHRYQEEMRERAQMTRAELIADIELDVVPSSDRYERDIEQVTTP